MWELSETKGYSQVLRPYLLEKLNQSFPDPSSFTKDEEFIYAAKVASVFKKVIAELLQWVDMQVESAKHLEKKERGELPEDAFRIGGDL